MMGEQSVMQEELFYGFSLERHVPADHLLRAIDHFVDLSGIRQHLAPYYSPIGRPSIDPELLIRMLIVGYCLGIRSERRLCEEVHLNLAYRWFCRLGLEGDVPDHSTFSKTRHGRFRDADLLRELFETVVRRCMAEGLVGGEGFAVDASMVVADAHRQRGIETAEELKPEAKRAVAEYLATLDDAAFGAATPVEPKFVSPVDPAARWTASWGGPAVYAYCTNYLIDVEHAIIVDVEPSTAVRQAEMTAAKTMIERAHEKLDLWPERLIADTGYGSAEMLNWLVQERGIEPHIPVFDHSKRKDGTFSREEGLSGILCARPVSSLADEPFAEDDGELGFGLEPLARRSFPILRRRGSGPDITVSMPRRRWGNGLGCERRGAVSSSAPRSRRGVDDPAHASGKAKNGTTCCQLRRQLWVIAGYRWPQ